MISYRDKKLKQNLHVLEADLITIKKSIDSMSLAQRMHFVLDMFQMIAIALFSIMNHFHVDWLHLF